MDYSFNLRAIIDKAFRLCKRFRHLPSKILNLDNLLTNQPFIKKASRAAIVRDSTNALKISIFQPLGVR